MPNYISPILSRRFQPQYLSPPRHFSAIASTPFCLEIGAGKGKHACLFAQHSPDKLLIAVERTTTKFQVLAKQQQLLVLDNLIPVHADAIAWCVYAVAPQQIEEIFLLYPNPEPHNPAQRWLNMPFFEFLLSRLMDGGRITLASNIASYIEEAEQRLQDCWQLPYEKQMIALDSARTHFEVKYLQRGEICQQLVITKPHHYQTCFDQMPARWTQING